MTLKIPPCLFSAYCFVFQAGIILCCLGCAIFGITEVPTDGVEFDTGDYADTSVDAGAAAPVGTNYQPPATEESSTEPEPVPDLEAGNPSSNTPVVVPTPAQSSQPQAPVVDLLDSQQATGTIDELD